LGTLNRARVLDTVSLQFAVSALPGSEGDGSWL